jgi:hypothetical protein
MDSVALQRNSGGEELADFGTKVNMKIPFIFLTLAEYCACVARGLDSRIACQAAEF